MLSIYGQLLYNVRDVAFAIITLGLLIFVCVRLLDINIRISRKGKKATPACTNRLMDWAALATGESGFLEIEQAWLRKCQELYQTFCLKQADYGPNNIGVGGLQGVTIRIGDKTSRLHELTGVTSGEGERKEKVPGESLRDAFMDLADYGIIGVLVYDRDWPLVNPKDVWGTTRKKQSKP